MTVGRLCAQSLYEHHTTHRMYGPTLGDHGGPEECSKDKLESLDLM
jgi:hypothetical protein